MLTYLFQRIEETQAGRVSTHSQHISCLMCCMSCLSIEMAHTDRGSSSNLTEACMRRPRSQTAPRRSEPDCLSNVESISYECYMAIAAPAWHSTSTLAAVVCAARTSST